MEKEYNEAELIETGRTMIGNGLGSAFVVKWLMKRVADEDERVQLMSIINGVHGSSTQQQDQKKILTDRAERNVKYLYQDFKSGQRQLGITAGLIIAMAVIFIISSAVFGAQSLSHAAFSLIFGLAIILMKDKIRWEVTSILYLGFFGYLLIILLAFLIIGYPDRIIPGFLETDRYKIYHITSVINDLTPMLYYFLMVIFSFPFIKMLFYLSKLKKTNKGIRMKLNITVE